MIPANRLPLLLAAVAAAIVIMVLISSFGGSRPQTEAALSTPPQSTRPPADGDTVADTLNTVAAELSLVKEQTREVGDLRTQQAELARQQQALTEQLRGSRFPEADALSSQLRTLQDSVANLEAQLAAAQADQSAAGSDIPNGLGIEPGDLPIGLAPGFAVPPGSLTPDQWTWIRPHDAPLEDGSPMLAGSSLRAPGRADRAAQRAPEPAPIEPRYTLPENATILDAVALTGLIGRVPAGGRVEDPYPVKVANRADGFSSQGIRLPEGLAGMTWSGVAQGDWGLGCIRAALDSVTYTFEDGTVTTVRSEDRSRPLAYIADASGNPCIAGQRITNAPRVLGARFGVTAFEAAARAYARGQQTEVVTGAGGVVSTIDNAGRFGAAEGLAGGARDATRWIDQRLGQSWDAVYALPGTAVTLHLQSAVPIDYDPQGRRLSHLNASDSPRWLD